MGARPPQGYSDPAARAEIENLKKRLDSLVSRKGPPSDEKLNLLYDGLIHHPRIRAESESLFKTGHYAQAIFEAFKTINNMVKEKSGRLDLDGHDLMAQVFNESYPILKLTNMNSPSEKDEQIGFRFIYMGVMRGIRNPKAHDNVQQSDPIRTLQYLSLADLLAKRIDETKLDDSEKNPLDEMRKRVSPHQRTDSVLSKLRLYRDEWPRIQKRITKMDFVRGDDPDIGRVKFIGDQLKEALSALGREDKITGEIRELATQMQELGTDLSRKLSGSFLFHSDDQRDFVERGDQILNRTSVALEKLEID